MGRREKTLALVTTYVIRLLRATVRLRFHDEATIREWERADQNFVLVFWHRHLPLMRYAYRGSHMCVLSSSSRDGDIGSRIAVLFGYRSVRGSSSKSGPVGLRRLLREAGRGFDIGLTPDGPRGPLRAVQPGVVFVASATGFPMIPVAIAANRYRELHTWDRMPIPLPGARVEIVYGEPLRVPRGASVDEWAPRIAGAINQTEQRAEALARGGAPAA